MKGIEKLLRELDKELLMLPIGCIRSYEILEEMKDLSTIIGNVNNIKEN